MNKRITVWEQNKLKNLTKIILESNKSRIFNTAYRFLKTQKIPVDELYNIDMIYLDETSEV